MIVFFEENLEPKQCKILSANCWQVHLCKDDPHCVKYIDVNGLYMSHYLAQRAQKEFNTPEEAMFEVETLLDIDVIADTDHDGGSLYYFRWQNPQWNGWTHNANESYPADYSILHHEWLMASGWQCAIHMYGAPKTARETAIELQRLRSIFSK